MFFRNVDKSDGVISYFWPHQFSAILYQSQKLWVSFFTTKIIFVWQKPFYLYERSKNFIVTGIIDRDIPEEDKQSFQSEVRLLSVTWSFSSLRVLCKKLKVDKRKNSKGRGGYEIALLHWHSFQSTAFLLGSINIFRFKRIKKMHFVKTELLKHCSQCNLKRRFVKFRNNEIFVVMELVVIKLYSLFLYMYNFL